MNSIERRSKFALAMMSVWYEFGKIEQQRPKPNGWLFMKTKGLIAYDRAITANPV